MIVNYSLNIDFSYRNKRPYCLIITILTQTVRPVSKNIRLKNSFMANYQVFKGLQKKNVSRLRIYYPAGSSYTCW